MLLYLEHTRGPARPHVHLDEKLPVARPPAPRVPELASLQRLGLSSSPRVGVQWCLLAIFPCIFLLTDHAKHLFMCLLGIQITAFVKCSQCSC